jgi:hypothetical protein
MLAAGDRLPRAGGAGPAFGAYTLTIGNPVVPFAKQLNSDPSAFRVRPVK